MTVFNLSQYRVIQASPHNLLHPAIGYPDVTLGSNQKYSVTYHFLAPDDDLTLIGYGTNSQEYKTTWDPLCFSVGLKVCGTETNGVDSQSVTASLSPSRLGAQIVPIFRG